MCHQPIKMKLFSPSKTRVFPDVYEGGKKHKVTIEDFCQAKIRYLGTKWVHVVIRDKIMSFVELLLTYSVHYINLHATWSANFQQAQF